MRGTELHYGPISHEPWPLHDAELVGLDDSLMVSAGYRSATGVPHVMWSPGVDVSIGRLRPADARARELSASVRSSHQRPKIPQLGRAPQLHHLGLLLSRETIVDTDHTRSRSSPTTIRSSPKRPLERSRPAGRACGALRARGSRTQRRRPGPSRRL